MSLSKPQREKAKQFEGAKLLVVDDNEDLRKLIQLRLKPLGFCMEFADSGEAALSTLEHFAADLVLTDLQMQGVSGIELFEHVHKKNPITPVIILTAHGTIAEAVAATQAGVAAYLSKPFDSQELIDTVLSSLNSSGFAQNAPLPEQDDSSWPYKSTAMSALMAQASKYASTDNLLLVEGEPGTGKDQFARTLYQQSPRDQKSLQQISCAALPVNVLHNEVFGLIGNGTERTPDKLGLLRQAAGGTIILSDYDAASDEFVHKILSAAAHGVNTHVDGKQQHDVDFRIIATTNLRVGSDERTPKIWSLVQTLNGTALKIPSLADRREDIPLIVHHCLSAVLKKPELQFSARAMQTLIQADWPGNSRHLLNVVRQCARLTTTKVISDELLKSRIRSPLHEIPPLSKAQRDFERDYLTKVLKLSNGNVTKASEIAKRNRTEFHRLLKKHRIEAQWFRANH